MFFSINIYHTACFFQAQETVLSAIGGCSVEQGLFFAPGTVAIGGCSVEQGLFFAPSTVRDPSSPCGTAP